MRMKMETVQLKQVQAVELEVPELPLRNLRVPQEEVQVKMQVKMQVELEVPARSKIRVLISIQKS
jgi:hypothetical protein